MSWISIYSRIVAVFWIVLAVVVLTVLPTMSATAAGSWRTVSTYVNSGNFTWDTAQSRASRPDICNGNYATYQLLISCILEQGESVSLWSSSPSAHSLTWSGNNTLPAPDTSATSSSIGHRVPLHDRIVGDIYYAPNISGTIRSSSGTIINLTPSTVGPKIRVNATRSSISASGSSMWMVAYNPNVEPFDPETYNPCLVESPYSDEPDLMIAKIEIAFIQVGDAAAYPPQGGTLKRPDDNCVWVVGSPPVELEDPSPNSPAGYLVCGSLVYQNPDGSYLAGPAPNAEMFRSCTIHTNGDTWPAGTQVGQYVEAPVNGVKFKEKPVDFTNVGDFQSGRPVNGAPGSVTDILAGAGDYQDFCEQFNLPGCQAPVKEIEKDPCTTKGFTHVGNRGASGQCIGDYDRDWPAPDDTYDPDKGFTWDGSDTPSDRGDVVDGRIVIVGPGDRGVVRPPTGGGGNNGPVQYPPSAGGGDSNTNPPLPGEVVGPDTGGQPDYGEFPAAGGVSPLPDFMGVEGDGFYVSAYPDGISSVWGSFQADIMTTPFLSSIGDFAPRSHGATDGDLHLGNVGFEPFVFELVMPDAWLDIGAILAILSACLYAFRLVFGG